MDGVTSRLGVHTRLLWHAELDDRLHVCTETQLDRSEIQRRFLRQLEAEFGGPREVQMV